MYKTEQNRNEKPKKCSIRDNYLANASAEKKEKNVETMCLKNVMELFGRSKSAVYTWGRTEKLTRYNDQACIFTVDDKFRALYKKIKKQPYKSNTEGSTHEDTPLETEEDVFIDMPPKRKFKAKVKATLVNRDTPQPEQKQSKQSWKQELQDAIHCPTEKCIEKRESEDTIITKLQKENMALSAEKRGLTNENERLLHENEQLQEKLEWTETRREAAQSDLDHHVKECEMLDEKIADLQKQNSELAADYEQATEDNASLINEVDRLKKLLQDEIERSTNMDVENEELRDRIEQLETENDKLKDKVAALTDMVNEAKDLAIQEQKNAILTKRLEKAEESAKNAKEENEALAKIIREQSQKIAMQEKRLDSAHSLILDKEKKIEKLQEDRDSWRKTARVGHRAMCDLSQHFNNPQPQAPTVIDIEPIQEKTAPKKQLFGFKKITAPTNPFKKVGV